MRVYVLLSNKVHCECTIIGGNSENRGYLNLGCRFSDRNPAVQVGVLVGSGATKETVKLGCRRAVFMAFGEDKS